MSVLAKLMNVVVNVKSAEGRRLNIPLIDPIIIAKLRIEKAENVAVRIELIDGCVGWGEVATLPPITAENQPLAMAKVAEVCDILRRSPGMSLSSVLDEVGGILHGHNFASVSLPIVFFNVMYFFLSKIRRLLLSLCSFYYIISFLLEGESGG